MAKNSLRAGDTKNSPNLDTVTPKKVLRRAKEMAIIKDGWLHRHSPSGFEQARRELTGESDTAPQEATLESLPESER
jgi:hypothetical protein